MEDKPIVLIVLGQTTPPLAELDEEVRNIHEAILEAGTFQIDIITAPNTDTIFEELNTRGNRLAIIHLASATNEKAVAQKASPRIAPEVREVDLSALARSFRRLNHLRLVFLNEYPNEDHRQALSKADISALITTRKGVPNHVACKFATKFYASLAAGQTVEMAFRTAEMDQVEASACNTGSIEETFSTPSVKLDDEPMNFPWTLLGPGKHWKLTDIEPRTRSSNDAALVSGGLAALLRLLRLVKEPQIRHASGLLRANILSLQEGMTIFGAYEELQDLLLDLQFKCQSFLQEQTRRTDPDDICWDLVEEASVTLGEELARKLASGATSPIPEHSLAWLGELEQARELIIEAARKENLTILARADWTLSRVISIRLAEMNTRLNEEAKNLNLTPLLQGLHQLTGELSQTNSPPKDLDRFTEGLQALGRVNKRLSSLVALRDAWHQLDRELRRVRGTLASSDTTDLNSAWEDLRKMAQKLIAHPIEREEKWLENSGVALELLQDAISSENIQQIRSAFTRFYREASFQFYRIDRELKELCDELNNLGADLGALLEKID